MSLKAIKIPTFEFVAKQLYALIFSGILIVISIGSLSIQGLKLGIDFTGGTLVEAGFDKKANVEQIRSKLAQDGFVGSDVQYFGSTKEVLIRLKPQEISSAKLSTRVISLLGDGADIRRVEFVGPKIGDELTEDGGLAMLYALIGILIMLLLDLNIALRWVQFLH